MDSLLEDFLKYTLLNLFKRESNELVAAESVRYVVAFLLNGHHF
jgi:hypothetical protein